MDEVPRCDDCGRIANPSWPVQRGGRPAALCYACVSSLDERLQLLIEAVYEHERATERKVSKDAWSLANVALYRARRIAETPRRGTG